MKRIIENESYLTKKIETSQKLNPQIDESELEFFDIELVQFPEFEVDKDGFWKFSGNTVPIITLDDLKKYKEMYINLMDFIKDNFQSSVARVYKNALNTLISFENRSKTSRLLSNMLNGNKMSESDVFVRKLDSENEYRNAVIDLNHVTSLVNSVKGKVARFKPFDIKSLMGEKKKQEKLEYVLPEFTEKGIKLNKTNGSLNINLKAVSGNEAEALRSFMLDQIKDDETLSTSERFSLVDLRALVENFFTCSKILAYNIENGNAKDVHSATKELVQMSLELFNDDPTGFLKRKKHGMEISDNSDFENEEENQSTHKDENELMQYDNSQYGEYESVSSINMHTSYLTNMKLENSEMIITLTTQNGSKFKIIPSESGLEVYEESEKPSEYQQQK